MAIKTVEYCAEYQKRIKIGQELNYSGTGLRDFVKERHAVS